MNADTSCDMLKNILFGPRKGTPVTRTNASAHYRLQPRGTTLLAALVLVGFTSASAVAAAPQGKMGPIGAPGPQTAAVPNAPFIVDGKSVELKAYLGHPFVIWQVATWCPSCKAGLETFAQHQADIDRSDMTILVLRDYKNGGYPGPGIREFAESVAPKLLNDPHFVFGEDTKSLFDLYNPHKFVDVYQVVAPDGNVAVVSSAPSANFTSIESFIKPKFGS